MTFIGGEILGIAGISGNGQKELLEAIAGLQITGQGSSIEFYERGKENQPLQLVGKTPKKIRDAGVHLAFVPEDRLGMGLVGSMGMTGNMLSERVMEMVHPRLQICVLRRKWQRR